MSGQTITQKNKKLVIDFFTLAFVHKQIQEAFDKYVGDSYIQHNPMVPEGKDAVIGFLSNLFLKENPHMMVSIKRVVAEDDLVVIHHHSKRNTDDRGEAIIEIFRVDKGKIVEHWDVIQPIPEEAANVDTMF